MARILVKPKTYNDYLNEACSRGDMEAIRYKRNSSKRDIAWKRVKEIIHEREYAVEDESNIEV